MKRPEYADTFIKYIRERGFHPIFCDVRQKYTRVKFAFLLKQKIFKLRTIIILGWGNCTITEEYNYHAFNCVYIPHSVYSDAIHRKNVKIIYKKEK